MKPRRVVITVEVLSAQSLKELKILTKDALTDFTDVRQIQANAIQGKK